MTITKDTIRKISNLAKISIADQEVEKLESEISSIIRWVEALNEVDTENVAPMSNSLTGVLRMREDLVTDGNKVSDILSNSPVDDENFFVVPKGHRVIMIDLVSSDLVSIRNSLQNKEFTAVELLNEYIDRIAKSSKLNLFNTTNFENALKAAQESDQKIISGEARSLEGIPIGVKDLFCTAGIKTTASSKILENFVPAYDRTITPKAQRPGNDTFGQA